MTTLPKHAILLLGAGGHARVLIETLKVGNHPLPDAALDANPSTWCSQILGVPVVGGDGLLETIGGEKFILGIASTGNTMLRESLFKLAVERGLKPITVIHPTAIVSPSAVLGDGAQLMAGAVVNTAAVLEKNVLVNTGAIIEHDCHIADHVHVASRACLAGGVKVGTGVHIGAGAVVREGISIGAAAIVGAGAVVINDVPAGAVVAGVPARRLPVLQSHCI